MAIADTYLPYADWPAETGIALRLVPGSIGFGGELQRATTSTGPWTTVELISYKALSAGEYYFFDYLPDDGSEYWYRARHIREGWNDGNWTVPIRARTRFVRDPYTDTTPTQGDGGGGGGGDEYFDAVSYGADGDSLQFALGITVDSGSFVAYTDDEPFQWNDVSKSIEIQGAGAGGITYVGNIAEVVTFATVSLSAPAESSVVDVPFRFGKDNRSVIQGLLEMAATDPTKPYKIYLRGGNYLVDTRAETASLQIQDNVTLFGDGAATRLISLGPDTAPLIINSESTNRNITVKDIALDGDKQFHDGTGAGSSAIKFDGVENFQLQNVLIESCSNDALQIVSSSAGGVANLRGNANDKKDVLIQKSSDLAFADVKTSGSLDYSIQIEDSLSCSFATAQLSEEGSGSFNEIRSTRIVKQGVNSLTQTNDFSVFGTLHEQFNDQLDDWFIGTTPFRSHGENHGFLGYSGSRVWMQFPGTVNSEITGSDLTANTTPGALIYVDYQDEIGTDGNYISIAGGHRKGEFATGQIIYPWTDFIKISLLSGSMTFSGSDATFNLPTTFNAPITASLIDGPLHSPAVVFGIPSSSLTVASQPVGHAAAADPSWLEMRVHSLPAPPSSSRLTSAAWMTEDNGLVSFHATRSLYVGSGSVVRHGNPEDWPAFMSMSATTGWVEFSGSDFHVAQQITSSTGFAGPASGAMELAWRGAVRPTFFTIQDMQNTFHSAGAIVGGTVTTGSASESIDVQSGSGYVREVDSEVAEIYYHDFAASSSIIIPTDATRYVGIDLNGGLPEIIVKSADTWDFNTDYPLAVVVNDTGSIHVKDSRHKVGDHANKMIQRSWETMPLARDERGGGLILGSDGRDISMTAGTLWDKLENFDIPAFDTSASSDVFDIYWQSGSGFEVSRSWSEWDNEHYDDGTGILATLSSNRYANMWFYVETDGDVTAQYGRDQYTSVVLAQAEDPPSSAPDRIVHLARLIGRIIFQEGAAITSLVETVFETEFAAAGVTDHGSLAGLADDDHGQYLLTDGTRLLTGEWETGNRIISELSGGFDGVVPSGSAVYHQQTDLGVQSASFTASFLETNAQKVTIGADITIVPSDIPAGGVNTLEIDNTGDHVVQFPGDVLWSEGIADTITSGSNSIVLQGLSIGTFVQIVGKDIQ